MGYEQIGIIYLIKQILTKYPSSKSALLEVDNEGMSSAFGPSIYKTDINDPALSNASQSSITLEIMHTFKKTKNTESSHKLAKSILFDE